MNKKKMIRRVISGVMALVLLASTLLYRAADVSFSTMGITDEAALLAAKNLLLGNDYMDSSRWGRMSAYMRHYLAKADTFDEYEEGVAIAIAKENYKDAIAGTEESIKTYEGDDEGLGQLFLREGYLYTLMQEYVNAKEMLDEGISLCPTSDAYLTRAQVKAQLEDTDGAAEDLKTYLALIDTDELEQMLPNLAGIALYTEDYELAAKAYEAQWNLSENTTAQELQEAGILTDENALLLTAFSLAQTGQAEQAQKYTAIYEQTENADKVLSGELMGLAYLREQNWEAAEEKLTAAYAEGDHTQNLIRSIVLCAYFAGDYETVCRYGDLILTGTFEEPTADTEKVLDIALPELDDETFYFLTGASFIQTEEYRKAREVLEHCREKESCTYLIGTCYLAEKEYEKAQEYFTASIEKDEETEKSYYARGVSRMEAGDRDGARDDFDYVCLQGTDEELFAAAKQLIIELTTEEKEDET